VLAFRNGDTELLLADGFHRYHAHIVAERAEIAVEIREGDRMAVTIERKRCRCVWTGGAHVRDGSFQKPACRFGASTDEA
jgi:hypothetical protein